LVKYREGADLEISLWKGKTGRKGYRTRLKRREKRRGGKSSANDSLDTRAGKERRGHQGWMGK